ncbi:Uncharacterised protein [Vibrio cholerae]|nr:Uncharacterised protein [Vibrio cholerae]
MGVVLQNNFVHLNIITIAQGFTPLFFLIHIHLILR